MLRGVEQVIFRIFRENGIVLRVAGIDSVNKGVAEHVFRFYPRGKIRSEVPKVDVLQNGFFEIVAVAVDEFAGEKDEAGEFLFKAPFEQKRDLCRETDGGSILRTVGVGERDARLGGVGENEAERGDFRQREIGVPIVVGLDAAGDDADLRGFHTLGAADNVMIFTPLRREQVAHSLLDRLHDHDFSLPYARVGHLLQHPVRKTAQKTAFPELNDLFGNIFVLFHYLLLMKKPRLFFIIQQFPEKCKTGKPILKSKNKVFLRFSIGRSVLIRNTDRPSIGCLLFPRDLADQLAVIRTFQRVGRGVQIVRVDAYRVFRYEHMVDGIPADGGFAEVVP